jgi:transposase InsO family protein
MMDACTGEVLAHVVSCSCDTDIVLQTLDLMMRKHGSELKTDALLHSDQGTQYTSHLFAEVFSDTGLRRSMSRKACCWDNAPQESLFGHMKEEIHLLLGDSHADIVRKVNDWIDYYNNDRPQWRLAKLTPREFYQYKLTGVYPLEVPPPRAWREPIGGSAPEPPEFIAFVSGEGEEKDDAE